MKLGIIDLNALPYTVEAPIEEEFVEELLVQEEIVEEVPVTEEVSLELVEEIVEEVVPELLPETSHITWIPLPEDTYYIPNAIWHKNKDNFYITTLNRKQNDLKFFRYDIDNNETTLVLNDKNNTWVDAYDFFGTSGTFNIDILDNDEIIWISERDGFKHIYSCLLYTSPSPRDRG